MSNMPKREGGKRGKGKPRGDADPQLDLDFVQRQVEVETLLNQRVSFTLLSQSIFVVAAVTAWDQLALVLVLSVVGVVFALVFTSPSVKLYFRSSWLTGKAMDMCLGDSGFREFVKYEGFDFNGFGWLSRWFYKRLIKPVESNDGPSIKTWKPKWQHSGWLYSWGLLLLCVGMWGTIIVIRFCFSSGLPPTAPLPAPSGEVEQLRLELLRELEKMREEGWRVREVNDDL
ncbi:MAG: hypothetical protein KIS87_14200 [Phycisphaeraceae bacterium]|nr:hypothetical protein [Phycisphaeraceae bacterium]